MRQLKPYSEIKPYERRTRPIYDYETDNTSFLIMSQVLKGLGVRNHSFHLALYDEELRYIDPFAGDLPNDMKKRVVQEALRNPVYVFRELTKVPVTGGIKRFELHMGNITSMYLVLSNVSFYLEQPRQTYKTGSLMLLYAYLFNFSRKSELMLTHHVLADSKNNLKKIIDTIDLYPDYCNFLQEYTATGAKKKMNKTKESYIHPMSGSTIKTIASAKSATEASNKGRGRTFNIGNYDEFGFIPYIKEFYSAARPAFTTASENARQNGVNYGIHITSTPPDLTTDGGELSHVMISNACKFTISMFDMTYSELHDYIYKNSDNSIVYCSFHWYMLGLTREWLNERRRELLDDALTFRRDYLMEWIVDLSGNPIDEYDMNIIDGLTSKTIVHEHMVDNKWLLKFHDITREEFLMKYQLDKSIIIGIDFAGSGKDSSAFVVKDSKTAETLCTFYSNRIEMTEFSELLVALMYGDFKAGLFCAEINAYGESFLSLLRTKHKHLLGKLYWEYKKETADKVESKKKIRYGLWNYKKVRDQLYDGLLHSARTHPHIIKARDIYDQLLSLVYDKKGRIDHKAGYHDDLIMANNIAYYVLTNQDSNIEKMEIVDNSMYATTDMDVKYMKRLRDNDIRSDDALVDIELENKMKKSLIEQEKEKADIPIFYSLKNVELQLKKGDINKAQDIISVLMDRGEQIPEDVMERAGLVVETEEFYDDDVSDIGFFDF